MLKDKKVKTSKNKVGDREAYGTPKYPYCSTPNSLRRFLEIAPDRPKPSKVVGTTLKGWGFKNTNDQSILRVLKKLELLSPSGETTSHYVSFMNKDSGPAVLGQRIKLVYSDLFENVAHPENANPEDLKNFFNTNAGGGKEAVRQQIETFKALS